MIRIFADSTCDLSPELCTRYNITIIPLFVVLGDKEYRDGIDISSEEIIKWSDDNSTTPKTAAPSIQTASDAFSEALDAGDEIIAFAISSKMSTSANVFRMAAEELEAEDRISIVDSASLSTGIGLQILEAADRVAQGMPREDIVRDIEALKSKVRASFVIDTLTYLHRGGRCGSVAALVGTMFNLHPRIDVVDGAMQAGRKFRGNIRKAVMHYAEELKDELLKAREGRVFITHSPVLPEIEQDVYEFVKSLDYFKEILITNAGGVISSHCGPGTLGVLYIEK